MIPSPTVLPMNNYYCVSETLPLYNRLPTNTPTYHPPSCLLYQSWWAKLCTSNKHLWKVPGWISQCISHRSSVDWGGSSHLGTWEPEKLKLHPKPGGAGTRQSTLWFSKLRHPEVMPLFTSTHSSLATASPTAKLTPTQQPFHVTLPCPQRNYSICEWHVAKMTFDLFDFTNNSVVDTGLEWGIKSFSICKSFKRIKCFNQTISISISKLYSAPPPNPLFI